MKPIDTLSVNALRIMAADGIQKANSGHPGLPLGSAPIAYETWAHQMNWKPSDPTWINRDRFILSGGHGSMMLYSLLYFFGVGDLTLDDLKSFRQLNSKTPGHPEYRHTIGVEATTGPLGAGMGMAVGMAMAEKHLAAIFNKEGYPVFDHYTYVLGGDGCLMEGISSEAFSLAGTLGLNKLIVLYDSNKITIEGATDLAFTENVAKRMEAFGFQCLDVADGNDMDAVGAAIAEAKADTTRPSFIEIHTQIGYGCPARQGTAKAHGEPLGAENIAEMRKYLGWPLEEAFEMPQEVYDNFAAVREDRIAQASKWDPMFAQYCEKYPEMKELLDKYYDEDGYQKAIDAMGDEYWVKGEKPEATRALSGKVLNSVKYAIPNIMGGSADLAPSNKTHLSDIADFSKETPEGRNVHFGVREFAMAAIGNGILLHGGLRSYVATFFVFADYVKPMARLSSLMQIPAIFVLSHDSIGVGEDGPTHEPIEQLAMLRATPNFNVFRPCDATETEAAWYAALVSKSTPTAIVITRQNLEPMAGSSKEALKGGYILEDCEGTPEYILLASGSEVEIAHNAKKVLDEQGKKVRLVSMPCTDLFDQQSEEYKESVLPKAVTKRVSIEAASTFGWAKYVGLEGKSIGMEGFGASGPYKELYKYFGFTAEAVIDAVNSL